MYMHKLCNSEILEFEKMHLQFDTQDIEEK